MRLLTLLLIVCELQISAKGYSQKVNLSSNSITLKDAFQAIKSQTGFSFFWKQELLDKTPPINVHIKNASIEEALQACLAALPITYDIQGRIVYIKEKPPEPAKEVSYSDTTRIIYGHITDQSGNPVEGVSVGLKGSSIGTVSSENGSFELSIPGRNGVLIFSSIGFVGIEKSIDGRSQFDVVMTKKVSALDEVVAVGYGTQKKVDLTGAITQISGKQLENRPVSNLEDALQGAIPGLTISAGAATGAPGGTFNVNIRGLASLANSSGGAAYTQGSPYILVDGIPMDLNDVDPNNIKSISVLKDAASSAIYGARAAYGVILITTKNGESTPGIKVSYSYNYALAQPTKIVHSVDGLTYALVIDSAAANAGAALPYSSEVIERIKQYMADPENTPGVYPNATGTDWDYSVMGFGANANTDWYDVLYRKNAIRQTHNISISGSGRNISYGLSVGLFNEDGVSRYANDQYSRKTLSGQLKADPLPWLSMGLVTKYVGSEDRNPTSNIVNRLAPTLPLKDPMGGFLSKSGIPQTMAQSVTHNTSLWVLSPNIHVEPVKDWVTTLQYNYTYTGTETQNMQGVSYEIKPDSSISGGAQSGTKYSASMGKATYTSPNITSTYHRKFGDHYISGLIGFQEELQTDLGLSGNASYLLTDEVASISSAVGTKTVSDSKSHWATRSYFARLNYNYKEKYLFEANVRRDGSSRFEPGSRWGTFPSVSVGYNIAKENFFPFRDQVSMMKFRASWGSIGNQNVANYLYAPLMSESLGTYLLGSERSNIINPPDETTKDLTWETVNTKDIGLDMFVFNNKLSITADWYQSDNKDLVGPGIVIPEIYGGTVPKANDGTLRTRGWEVQVNWKQLLGKGFSYFANFNLSNYRSVVTSYNNPLKLLSTFYKGEVIGEIWGYKTDGLIQSEAEYEKRGVDQSYIYNGAWNPGDVMYRDLDGNKIINNGSNEADDHGDLSVIGNNQPRFQYGLYAGASYKGFDISFLIQGIGKRDYWTGSGGQNAFWGPTEGPGTGVVVLKGQEDFWSYSNPDAYWPRPYLVENTNPITNKNKATSDRYLQNRSYARLKSLQVGYSFPVSLIKRLKASQLRIYFSGNNLFTRTKFILFDPEVGDYDRGSYPLQKVFSFGANVSF